MNKHFIWLVFLLSVLSLKIQGKDYYLCYDRPAYNRGGNFNRKVAGGFPYDEDWEKWSLPIGNGAIGACIFGRTDTERIQIAEKTLGNKGPYKKGNFTSFAEVYLDFNHYDIHDYKRVLSLNKGTLNVSYTNDNIKYTREYIASYPDQVIAIKIKSDKPRMTSFAIRARIPYIRLNDKENNGRSGDITVNNNLITMNGKMEYYNLPYEGQIKVINYGGTIENLNRNNQNGIQISQADSVVILIAAATSYQLNENVFLLPPSEKFKNNKHPHDIVSKRITNAEKKGYNNIYADHMNDYNRLFDRVEFKLDNESPTTATDKLLYDYRSGKRNTYLEEVLFQYGRYLLIASSRDGSLPANLQGAWTQYDYSPWSGGYWHNINVQMNYWPAFSTNIKETFKAYMDYNETYRKAARRRGLEYLSRYNKEAISNIAEENGWIIGTGATAFEIDGPGGHSGPGTGGFTTKLFWDYYDFTRNKTILKEHVYPALLDMAKFLSKTLKEQPDGTLLVDPSYSPEQMHKGKYYKTIGCTFDQSMIWETFNDLLKTAEILKIKSPFLKKIKEDISRLDPIKIGTDGQIKEYREENKYGDIGEYNHRHISHLCALYPGTLITSKNPEWMNAAIVTLTKRGDKSTGWAMAHRLNLWARAKKGDRAYTLYKQILNTGITENFWGSHPPFQIDANFGATAGVSEMLLQSHEGYIEPIPAIPEEWNKGEFKGLIARGNFEVSASWEKGYITKMSVISNMGELCRIKIADIKNARITNNKGKAIKIKYYNNEIAEFKTEKGETYFISFQ